MQQLWDRVWANHRHGTYAGDGWREDAVQGKVDLIAAHLACRPGQRVLEAGCGDGRVLLSLVKRYAVTGHGVDFSPVALKAAKKLMKEQNAFFRVTVSDVHRMPYGDGFFDSAVSLGVVEHYTDPRKAIRELYRVLRPGGKLMLMTPNLFSCGTIDHRIKVLARRWPFGYQAEFSPHQLARMAQEVGFHVVKQFVTIRTPTKNQDLLMRMAMTVDRWLNRWISSWGFYSYVYCERPVRKETE